MRSHRSHLVSCFKGCTSLRQKISLVFNRSQHQSFLLFQRHSQKAVVGSDEEITFCASKKNFPGRPDSWINNNQKDRALRKIFIAGKKDKASYLGIKGVGAMGNVHNLSSWVNFQDSSLKGGNEKIILSEIGHQSDERILHSCISYSIPLPRSTLPKAFR